MEITQGQATTANIIYKPRFYQTEVNGTESTLRINEYYYPGWKAFVDGKETEIFYKNQYGLIEIPIPAGKHLVRAIFGNTPLRTLANIISLISVMLIIFMGITQFLKRGK